MHVLCDVTKMRDSAQTELCGPMSCSVGRVTEEEVSASSRSDFNCSVPPASSSSCPSASYCMTHCVSQPCMPVSNVGPTKILPYLYLGSQRDALCQETLTKNGITYIVNVTTSIPRPAFIQETNFHRIPIDDTYLDKLVPFFQEAFQFLDKAREANAFVLVHCLAGVSRSATLVIAYVMSQLGLNTEEAYRYVKEKRPTISPNFNFLGQLVEFEQQLQSSNERLRNRSCCSSRNAQPSCCNIDKCNGRAGQGKYLGLPPVTTTAADLSKVINSPTTAMSRLSFTNLSPLQEHATPPSGETPAHSKPSISGAAAEAGLVLALNQSGNEGGVTIRLGAKHNYAGSKRPLSSPTFGAGLAAGDEVGGSSMKQKRPMTRPNSIGIVPVGGLGRPGEGFNFSSGKSEHSWLSRRCNRVATCEQKTDDNLSSSGGNAESDNHVEIRNKSGIMDSSVLEKKENHYSIPACSADSEFKLNLGIADRDSGERSNQSRNYGFNMISNQNITNHNDKRVPFCHPQILVSELEAETVSVNDCNNLQSITAQEISESSPMDTSHNHNSTQSLSPTRKTRSLDDILETPGECVQTFRTLLSPVDDFCATRKYKPPLCETRSLGREFARISKDKRRAMIFNADRDQTVSLLASPIGCDIRACASLIGERAAVSLDYQQNSPLRDSPSTLYGSAEMIQVS